MKGGSEAREKAGLEELEDSFQMSLEVAALRPMQEGSVLAEVLEVYEKKGSTVKGERRGGEKSHAGGKKSDGGGKKSNNGGKKSDGGGKVSN